jgi:hypothetical protein
MMKRTKATVPSPPSSPSRGRRTTCSTRRPARSAIPDLDFSHRRFGSATMSDPRKRESRRAAGSSVETELQASQQNSTTAVVSTTDLALTASEIHNEHEAAQRCASEAVAHAIRAGELLMQAKAALPHGAFGPWLAANVEFSDRTARGYMRLAGLDEAKRQRVADLSLRGALRSLTSSKPPATPEQERARDKLDLLQDVDEAMQAILAGEQLPPEHRSRARSIVRDCQDMLLDIGARGPQRVSLFVVDLLCTLDAIKRRDRLEAEVQP